MKATRGKGKQPVRRVSLEISRTDLSMVIVEGVERCCVRGHRVPLQLPTAGLGTDDGVRELVAALTTLASKEKLAGVPVRIALSSDFCVTRVVADESERGGREVRNLRERSGHYLWLGAGPKALAESSRPIDAKQMQTWLTVANERTLTQVMRAAQQAGLQVELIEHSMLALCRALGRTNRDKDSPVIIIELDDRGVDLGVSYRGQLLFDYRPGGIDSKARVAEIAARHLDRIQRYCNRFFRFAGGQISQVFLCGSPEDVARAQQGFSQWARLKADLLDPKAVCPEWDCEQNVSDDSRFVSQLGAALVEKETLQQPAESRGLPDLMDHFRKAWREPLWPALPRLLWPIAATILLALAGFAVAWYQDRKATALTNVATAQHADRGRVNELRLQMQGVSTRASHLQQIRSKLVNPPWNETVRMIGHCLPRGSWLESVRVEQPGAVAILGTGPSEDAVYEFVRHLKNVPVLQNVSLESQRPTRLQNGSGIMFDIKSNFVGRNDHPERTARNDRTAIAASP